MFRFLSEIFIRPPLAESRGGLEKITVVFYCAPHKLLQTLKNMQEVYGDIEIVVTRELTKVYEEVVKLNVSDALSKFAAPKGEFTILFRLMEKE